MYQFYNLWSIAHPLHKVHQILLIGVGAVATYGVDLGFDGVLFVFDAYVAMLGAIFLDDMARGTVCLVADEKDIIYGVGEQGFEVVDYPATGAHAAGGYDNGGTSGGC